MSFNIDIGAIQTAIDYCGLEASASELHGIVTALICFGIDGAEIGDNLVLLSGNQHLDGEAADHLLDCMTDIHRETLAALEEGDFSFSLLLPSDDAAIAIRTEALADWCQGYLLGLLHEAGGVKIEQLNETVQEALNDMMSIAEAESGSDDEETETRALTELEEFLRASINLIYEEMCAPASPGKLH